MTLPTTPGAPVTGTMLAAPIRRALAALDRLLSGRRWILIVVLLAAATSLLVSFPTYDNFDAGSADWVAIQRIAEHPFDQTGLDPTDRSYNFTFRVAVPFLGRILHLGPAGYLVVQAIAGLCLFAAVAHLVERISANRRLAALAAIATGLMWAGASAFVELRGNFDAVALALLVVAMASRRPPVVLLCTFAAAWTDERALPIIAFVALFHHVVESRDLRIGSALREPRVLAAVGGVVLHVVTRIAVVVLFDVKQPSNLGVSYIQSQINILPIGAWTGLEGFWIFVVLGAAALWQARGRLLALAYGGLVALVAVASIAVTDVTRSMAYLLPAAFAGLAVLCRFCPPRLVRSTTYLAVALTALWPLYYAGGENRVYWVFPLPLVIVRHLAGVG